MAIIRHSIFAPLFVVSKFEFSIGIKLYFQIEQVSVVLSILGEYVHVY